MKAVQVPGSGKEFEVVQRDVPSPAPNEVLIDVQASGICHSDEFVKDGQWPGLEYPRVPGHEIAGEVEETGQLVESFQVGDPVGVGWHGGHCTRCEACRHGDFINCSNARVTGISYDGGYAEYVTVPEEAVAHRPEELPAREAAPLMCAGNTTYQALRESRSEGGDLAAIQGIGGLGHLAIQYADAFGYDVAALSGSPDKESEAFELGAERFINVNNADPGDALKSMGGADVILTTAPSGEAVSSLIPGLAREGELLVAGVDDSPVEFSVLSLIQGRKTIQGWTCGSSIHSEQTLQFSLLQDIRPKIEVFDLAEAGKAYRKMINGNIRYRAVLVP
ncbi:MAG: alcohol dehydrogenase [bacterium]